MYGDYIVLCSVDIQFAGKEKQIRRKRDEKK
jgi:hypothetical protein